METQICKVCERELPIDNFALSSHGTRCGSCNDCRRASARATRMANRLKARGGNNPISDPDFDGKDPVEVIQLMGRAKNWLESRGFTIRLSGEYTQVRQIKF